MALRKKKIFKAELDDELVYELTKLTGIKDMQEAVTAAFQECLMYWKAKHSFNNAYAIAEKIEAAPETTPEGCQFYDVTIKPCPFCGRPPQINSVYTSVLVDDGMDFRRIYSLCCNNPECPTKPHMQQIDLRKAIDVLNTRQGKQWQQ